MRYFVDWFYVAIHVAGDRHVEFLRDSKRFGELEVMVRESSADFDHSQVAAVQDLANLRPFLVGGDRRNTCECLVAPGQTSKKLVQTFDGAVR